ncbi:YraN family protein [Candidatus Saccharibacteria bacterium]|nr:YraN family protein [Candidatus Saccharibacteria bacterium]
MSTTSVGRQAESQAVRYLLENNYQLIERNARNRFYELDIIASHGETIVFIEVKYRRQQNQGGGVAALTRDKGRHLRNAALVWLSDRLWFNRPFRFDVIDITGSLAAPRLTHYPDCLAFDGI